MDTPGPELRDTAAALGRWQGTVEANLKENHADIKEMRADFALVRADLTAMKIDLTIIRTRTAVYSGIGGVIGAGVVSAAVAILTGS